MSRIDEILSKEEVRIIKLKEQYLSRISLLPKGSLVIRKLNNKKYCYLCYRKNGKVVSEYAGTALKETELKAAIESRKNLQEKVVALEKEIQRIARMKRIQ